MQFWILKFPKLLVATTLECVVQCDKRSIKRPGFRAERKAMSLLQYSYISHSLYCTPRPLTQVNKTFLIIKPTRFTNFSNLLWEWNSTCFGQFFCPSSGVFHCTNNNGICHTGLLTACERDHNGTAVPSWFCSQAVSTPVWHIPLLCVQWKTPDDGQKNCPKHVEFYSKNVIMKLVHLVGFIIRNSTRRAVTWTSNWTGTFSLAVVKRLWWEAGYSTCDLEVDVWNCSWVPTCTFILLRCITPMVLKDAYTAFQGGELHFEKTQHIVDQVYPSCTDLLELFLGLFILVSVRVWCAKWRKKNGNC
jgi:hypothetical protein